MAFVLWKTGFRRAQQLARFKLAGLKLCHHSSKNRLDGWQTLLGSFSTYNEWRINNKGWIVRNSICQTCHYLFQLAVLGHNFNIQISLSQYEVSKRVTTWLWILILKKLTLSCHSWPLSLQTNQVMTILLDFRISATVCLPLWFLYFEKKWLAEAW